MYASVVGHRVKSLDGLAPTALRFGPTIPPTPSIVWQPLHPIRPKRSSPVLAAAPGGGAATTAAVRETNSVASASASVSPPDPPPHAGRAERRATAQRLLTRLNGMMAQSPHRGAWVGMNMPSVPGVIVRAGIPIMAGISILWTAMCLSQ